MPTSVAIGEHDVPVLGNLFGKDEVEPGIKAKTKAVPFATPPVMPSPKLVARADTLSKQCRRLGFGKIRSTAIGLVFKTPLCYPQGTKWSMILMPAGLDPTRTAGGRFPIPVDVQRRLRRAVEAGIDFDRIYIAHEMDGHPLGASPRVISPVQAAAHIPRRPATATARGIHKTLSTSPCWGVGQSGLLRKGRP